MERPNLDLQKLRAHFAPHILERGQKYQRSGEVLNLTLRGNTVSAGVQGSDTKPYRVTLTLSGDDLEHADCTCPYTESFGDYCKHIAAAALEVHFWPEHIISEASVGELLEPLGKDDLRGAVEYLLMLYPEAIDALELYLQKAQIQKETERKIERATSEPDDPPAEPALDTRLFEKLMRTAVRGAGRDWDGFPEYEEVYKVIGEIKAFLERAAYRDALALTCALINTFINEVNSIEDMYEGIGFSDEWIFDDFDRYLTEAVLGLVLGEGERKRLLYEVFAWNDQIGNEWTNPSLSMAAHALVEGLQTRDAEAEELLAEVARLELSRADRNTYSEIRLRVLRETGRSDEALAFAETTGQGAGYLGVLLEQGKLSQVMVEYQKHVKNEQDALTVARQLGGAQPEEALEVAQYGLKHGLARATEQEHSAQQNRLRELGLEFIGTNSGRNDRLALASFTKDLAARVGNHQATLDASLIEFELVSSLPRYEALRTLSGADWPQVQEQLFTSLRNASYPNYDAAADIFLKEGLPDDAVKIASRSNDDNLLQKVMGAVTHTHASWVISTARGKAEPIMDGGRSNHYDSAARWLGYAKTAYGASGRAEAWQAYVTVLRGKHKRKYRLLEALEGL